MSDNKLVISDEAVEAAAKANYEARTGKEWRFLDNFQRPIEISWMRQALEAAAPYMASAWHDAVSEAYVEGSLSADQAKVMWNKNPYRSQA